MAISKITIGVLCGGKSGEHEVSLISAKNILAALNPNKYNILVIGIEKSGTWHLSNQDDFLISENDITKVSLNLSKTVVYLSNNGHLIEKSTQRCLATIDVFFPITHGTYGEDGTLQGILRFFDVAYVGPDVTGSAIGMDKDVTKRLLRDSGLPVTPFITLRKGQTISFEEASAKLGNPLFIKPCRLGSSLGISKASNQHSFDSAIKLAFAHDRKILIEQGVKGREIECAVFGNENPQSSAILGEIVPKDEFYSYAAKYVDKDGAELVVPAELNSDIVQKLRQAAISAFTILECEGLARIDFFVKSDGSFTINEINTLPGFTSISMYPRLWKASGLSYSELLDQLIEFSLERYAEEKQLQN